MPTVKHYTEYYCVRGLSALINIIPYRVALAFGCFIGILSHYVFRFRVAEARRRISSVFGDSISMRERNRIAWVSWRNTCFNAVEIIRMQHLDMEYITSHANPEVMDKLRCEVDKGQGLIMAVPHMGNWDLAGVSAHVLGFPFLYIARRQKNELTNDFLNKKRSVTGIETIMSDDRGLLKNLVRRLRTGALFAMLPDVRSRTPALTISFLGEQANIAGGMAVFSRMSNVPVFPGIFRRKGWSQHVWEICDPIYPDNTLSKKEDHQRMTQHVFDIFTKAIHETPEQYFWYNKRWVLEPLPDEEKQIDSTTV